MTVALTPRPCTLTSPIRYDVLHFGVPKMAGLVLPMHPDGHGRRLWAFYHAHSGTQSTRHYADAWGIGIDQVIAQELLFEAVHHIYIHDKARNTLHYTHLQHLLNHATKRAAHGRWRLFLPEQHWTQRPLRLIPEPIPRVPESRWIRLNPPRPDRPKKKSPAKARSP